MFSLNKRILGQALDLSPVPTAIVDLKANPQLVVYVNQAFEAASGFDAGELLEHPWEEMLTGHQGEPEDAEFTVRIACHSRLGADEQLVLDMLPLYEKPGTPRFWVGTEQQFSESRLQEHDQERDALRAVLRDARMHLRRMDGRDSATGLLNRRTFEDMLQRDWVMARREKRSLGLIILQVDGFDGYREVYGRHAADSCLRKIAHAITGSLRRGGDLTARFSDDQFVVLVGETDPERAARLASNIGEKVRGLSIHHPRSPVDRYVTVSFGVSTVVPTASTSIDHLLEIAAEALAELPSTKEPGVTA
ncbi:MAG: hypothetical protein CL799_07805 [Chromatiales bacterium]|jgi:diguanylate cyclase (GGDEF)-like protein|nr:hypothetical protein [Chromatiales bacterium]